MASAGAFIPHAQVGEMIKEQWKKIGIQADIKEVERSLFFTRVRSTSTRSPSGRTTAPSCCISSPGTGFPWIRASRSWARRSRSGIPRSGKQGKAPDDTQLMKALDMFRSANGKKTAERNKIAQEI